jgi:hypothetical protein
LVFGTDHPFARRFGSSSDPDRRRTRFDWCRRKSDAQSAKPNATQTKNKQKTQYPKRRDGKNKNMEFEIETR